ncbi:sec-independent protein translocase protein TatB [Bradyrhizobium sp. SSBR45G]|uniref:Sec-independent protein translocase protein TatB n=1 Tax=unclassified Bradyrhizobium TaxID=2631580 RepID=UPI002342BA2B|nr:MULTISPECIES: Sec-independent protein translocase protein TatB [unclassified Bradyrhizobium]GLH76012.1 sec-independent protein translocase protein TatB [Bradyrhizobium sp. SSBR45G]GLH89213.1 sec-independent protein translocase protein TatB [Bradyrhizobium sp. SSBR45R]
MFDIGWSELLVIGVVALVAIGPKELPGVLRTIGQWMGKARRMASEFQSQFQEAMREAEMADLKKSFDEVKEAASGFSPAGMMSSLQRDVDKALDIEGVNKPAETAVPAADAVPSSDTVVSSPETPVIPTTPEAPRPETFVEAEAHQAVGEPLAIVREIKPEPQPDVSAPAEAERLKDAKAS